MKTLAFCLTLAVAASVEGLCMAGPEEQPPPPPAAVPVSSPLVEDIMRLWKANLSEEFITKYVAHSDLARDLTAEDVVLLRGAGVPETLITSITLRRDAVGASASPAQKRSGPHEARRWDGLARRNGGIVMLKSRWDTGYLEFKDASLRWVDARDSAKNVLLPAAQLTEQQLTCLKKAGGNECFEWVVKTRSEEYRFRDVGWKQGDDAKVEELFAYFSGAYPNLISSRQPVDEK